MNIYLIAVILFAIVLLPLVPLLKGMVSGKKVRKNMLLNGISFVALCTVLMIFSFIMPSSAETAAVATAAASDSMGKGISFLAVALTMGIPSIGAGIAIAAAAPAAIGASSEDPKMYGKSIVFVALGESIVLFGFLISIMMLNKI